MRRPLTAPRLVPLAVALFPVAFAGCSSDGEQVPASEYCAAVRDWDPGWAALEEEVVVLVNDHRAAGTGCGGDPTGSGVSALTMNAALRCAARVHSQDMAERGYFDHVSPSGEEPWDRIQQAGYTFSAAAENIAAGSPSASAVVEQWMQSPGHCSNIMSPDFVDIGVGYYPGGQYGHLWTQTFGRP